MYTSEIVSVLKDKVRDKNEHQDVTISVLLLNEIIDALEIK